MKVEMDSLGQVYIFDNVGNQVLVDSEAGAEMVINDLTEMLPKLREVELRRSMRWLDDLDRQIEQAKSTKASIRRKLEAMGIVLDGED